MLDSAPERERQRQRERENGLLVPAVCSMLVHDIMYFVRFRSPMRLFFFFQQLIESVTPGEIPLFLNRKDGSTLKYCIVPSLLPKNPSKP